jgi:SAM-dependent methyltransferase
MPTLYDEVLYPNLPFAQTHPDRLATIATLFGMDPAPLASCRVLELACGSGDNLIPIAAQYPASQFLGIDAAAVVVSAGNQEIADLGLANIRLEHADIMQLPPGLGPFDYVIAHGFYSWVPEPVRDRLMKIVQSTLAPEGVAYISYNALPGGHIREMFRDMMLFHLDGAAPAAARELDPRIGHAREIVRWFSECRFAAGESGIVQAQIESVLGKPGQCLYHDELGEVFHPVYLRQFLAHAGRFGLQFLSEANYSDMNPAKHIPAHIVEQVDRLTAGNRILRDQYFDFLRCRMFRQTLLCRWDLALPSAPLPERLRLLHASSPVQPVSPRPDLTEGVAEEFQSSHGSGLTSTHPFTKAVMKLLGEAWPATVSFADLLARAASFAPEAATPENLADLLLATYAPGIVELHREPAPCVPLVSTHPVAAPLARSQAARGRFVTTSRHTTIEADEPARLLISVLDGRHDLAALARELAPRLGQHEANVLELLPARLHSLARAGLLVG